MAAITLKLTSESPLLMHNVVLADPLGEAVRELKPLTSKRNKTDDDQREIAFLEFKHGMYFDSDAGPCIKGHMIRASILGGAKKQRAGAKVKSGLLIVDDVVPLEYDGPRDIANLWKKGFHFSTMVGNQKARIRRTRPMFRKWSVTVDVHLDESVMNEREVIVWAKDAGRLCGLGDWRPETGGTYGRFSVEKA